MEHLEDAAGVEPEQGSAFTVWIGTIESDAVKIASFVCVQIARAVASAVIETEVIKHDQVTAAIDLEYSSVTECAATASSVEVALSIPEVEMRGVGARKAMEHKLTAVLAQPEYCTTAFRPAGFRCSIELAVPRKQ